jgi:ribonuclease P protein component
MVVHLDPGTGDGAAQDLDEPLGLRGGRAGVTVSKAVGNAVVRNRVKRRLRHLLAERIGAFPRASALVVRALPAAGTATFQALGSDLDAALGRLHAEAVLRSVTR